MANLGTLTLDLIAKTGNFIAGLDKAQRASKKFAERTKRNAKIAATAFAALATATAAATAAMIKSYSATIDENAKAAKQVEASYSSFATLKQATGDAGVSMSVLMSASRTLNRELGKAIGGNEKVAASFHKIGLEAKDLVDLPLEQRIGKINEALDKNVDANQRAAISAEIFGSRNGQAMAQMNPDVINDAARALDVFGLRLSDVDAAKVEQANSAMSNFKLLMDGVGTQLTVHVAPALKAIGDLFIQSAEEAGGLGEAVGKGVGTAVKALAFLMDMGDGVKRLFELVADSAITYFARIAKSSADTALFVTRALDSIPGVDMSDSIRSLEEFSATAQGVVREAADNMRRTLDEPLAGEKFLKFYEKAQKEGQKAAEAAVRDREARRKLGAVYEESADSMQKAADTAANLIANLELEAATLGMSSRERARYKAQLEGATAAQLEQIDALHSAIDAYEQGEKSASDYLALVAELRTEEERRTETLREQMRVIRESGEANAELAARAARAALDFGMPTFSGGDSPVGELHRFAQEEEELQSWYDRQLEMLAGFRQEYGELSGEWDERELEARKHYAEQMDAIDRARQDVMLGAASEMFGGAADMAKQFLGESNKIYRALFALEKSAAISRSLIAIQEGIALAAANPWPINLGAMASVAAATAGIVSNIMAVGMAHDGIDEVPKTGTWLLEKGERVMTEKTSAKLDRTLDEVGRGQGGTTINLIEDVSKAGQTQEREQDGETIIDIFISNILGDGPAAAALEGKYGLATVGR